LKISLNWLNDYIDLKNVPLDVIFDKLTYSGLEVEDVVDQSKKFDNMVVGLVKESIKHPNADKLSLCKVSDGTKEFNVICGAPNVAAGQKIAFAKIGAVIPNSGFKIEKAKIRGEVSQGMICSEKELGISDNHDGIMVLDAGLKEGSSLADALGLNDVVFEVAITPNRADALSHIGVARDLSALLNKDLKFPEVVLNESLKKANEFAEVEIIDSVNCPRYVGKVISNVEIKESPEWIKTRLKSIGLRPINNVVDVTNYILYEVGQPLHAFDLDNLAGRKIVVRGATQDEKFVTLDSKERKMRTSDLMICDSAKPVAIAGVMGGENSEVTPETKNILIESAYFNPSSVRKTAKHLGLSTDASYRFERGTDPLNTIWAAKRAAQLIQQTAGGEIAASEIDAYPNIIKEKNCVLRYARIEKILGYKISNEIVEQILTRLGFKTISKTNTELCVTVPAYRHDIEREIDLIEEIARIYGYDKIPENSKIPITLEEKVDQSAFNDLIRELLNALGFYEIITNTLIDESTANLYENSIPLLNPQNSEMSHLRPSLIPGMLRAISTNLKVNEYNLNLFEIGKTFWKLNNEPISDFKDFNESEHVLIALTGNPIGDEWYEKKRMYDLYDLKGCVEELFNKLIYGSELKYNYTFTDFSINQGFELLISDKIVGWGGQISSNLLDKYDVSQNVFIIQLNLDALKKIEQSMRNFKELLKFPKVYRDFSFILDDTVIVESVVSIIRKASSNLLHNIKLFDIFQSESLGKEKKSLAFQLEYFDQKRTLTEEEVDKDFRNAIKAVEQQLKAQLRGT
jgi:phenylalanyl-tRNA synthetase beta chain